MRHLIPATTALVLGVAPFGPVPARAAEHVVTMAGMAYVPAELRAEVGDTIRFVNDDVADHNVFVPTATHGVDLGKQEPGREAVLPVGQPGGFEVECVFHPDMLLEVHVGR